MLLARPGHLHHSILCHGCIHDGYAVAVFVSLVFSLIFHPLVNCSILEQLQQYETNILISGIATDLFIIPLAPEYSNFSWGGQLVGQHSHNSRAK